MRDTARACACAVQNALDQDRTDSWDRLDRLGWLSKLTRVSSWTYQTRIGVYCVCVHTTPVSRSSFFLIVLLAVKRVSSAV